MTAALFRQAAIGNGRGWRLGLAVLGFSGHQLGEVMVPVAVGLVIDHAIAPGDSAALGWSLGLLAAAFLLLIVSWQTGDRLVTRVYARAEHDLRQEVVGRVLRARRNTRPPGEVLTVASSDTAQVAGIAWVVVEQSGALAALLAAGVVLVTISWPLALAVLAATVLQGILVHLLSGRLRERSFEAQTQAGRLDALGTDFATGLRTLEGLRATDAAVQRYRAESASSAAAAYLADRSSASLSAVNTMVAGLVFAGLAALAGALALHDVISIGAFITTMGLAQTIRGPLQTLGFLPGALAAKHGSARRIRDLLDEPWQIGGLAPPSSVLDVRWKGVDVVLGPGEIVGVQAGMSAADLVELLGGRREARPGEFRLGTIEGSEIAPEFLRNIVFAAQHHSAVFSGSVRDALGDVDDAVLEASGLHEVLARLPDGLDEELGENGSRLSGGQRQRLLLARALSRPHPVLVLHEPTTAIDPVTEARIALGIATHLEATGQSLLLITERPALLAICDRVVATKVPE